MDLLLQKTKETREDETITQKTKKNTLLGNAS
jgi:hypothetical protein